MSFKTGLAGPFISALSSARVKGRSRSSFLSRRAFFGASSFQISGSTETPSAFMYFQRATGACSAFETVAGSLPKVAVNAFACSRVKRETLTTPFTLDHFSSFSVTDLRSRRVLGAR